MTLACRLMAILLIALPAACASSPGARSASAADAAVGRFSSAAQATAVRLAGGGRATYATADDALKAGDTAAYLGFLAAMTPEERDKDDFAAALLALDRVAAGDISAARSLLGITGDAAADFGVPGFRIWIDAWLLALEGRTEDAFARHREVAADMPGITGDLSLAALLEAAGRPEEALAVFEALTPDEIIAPEHEFDPQGILFSHVRTVVVRHALLLQRLGRIEEAKQAYRRLAIAEPEEATSYAAALESLETGRNLDNKPLTLKRAFVQSLADVSGMMQQQRYLRAALLGDDLDGFDPQRTAFDLVSLLLDPGNENLRATIINGLYDEAFFEGAAHVALSAPMPTAGMQISAARSLLMAGRRTDAEKAIARALRLAGPDERVQTLYGALQLRSLLGDREGALALVPEVLKAATNAAELAAANAAVSNAHAQFGQHDAALKYAAEARRLDDTNARRMALAHALGEAGRINEALVILRAERLARPNDPYALNSLGYFLITRTDRLEEGYKVLVRALMLAENDPYIADSVGWALYLYGDLERARDLIEASRDKLLPHRHWEIEDHLGDIYWHLGDREAARAAWTLALGQYPPEDRRAAISLKLGDGLTGPAPARRPLPEISLDDPATQRRGI